MAESTPSLSDSASTKTPIENSHGLGSLNGAARSAPTRSSANLNARSCVTCRRRKVKCGKSHPCSNCMKAGIECMFPGPGREKSRKPQDTELLARLKKLEDAIQSRGGQADVAKGGQEAPDAMSSIHEQPDAHRRPGSLQDQNSNGGSPNSVDKHLGRLVINEGQRQYVSSSFWANMGDEVAEIRDILNNPSSEDDSEMPSPRQSSGASSSLTHQGFVFGYSLTLNDLQSLHPSQTQSFVLLLIFEETFDPVVRIVHRPTVRKIMIRASNGRETLSKAEEALLFSIYYGAVCSLTPEQCQDQIGGEQEELANRFRCAVEQALARANFLSTTSIMVMQAFVLFLICLRSQDDTRMVWSLTGLIRNLAQSIGVHRDGTNFSLSPFETEMRRRLWWHISLLDSRSTEDHGVEPSFTEAFYDTKLPLNINDEDISPETKDFPKERVGTTEMTFCLIRFELSEASRRISFAPPGVMPSGMNYPVKSLAEKEKLIEETHKRIEERYLQYCDMMVPIYWASATVGRLVLAKLWLMAYHPLQYSRSDSQGQFTQDARDRLFVTSIEVMEYSCMLENNGKMAKWGWLFRTYMQWHAVAFVLSELCYRPPGPDYERAWKTVQSIYDKRVVGCPKNQKGMLWRPMRQLMAKAQAITEARKRGISFNANQMAHNTQDLHQSVPWQKLHAPGGSDDCVPLGSKRGHMDAFGLFDETAMSGPAVTQQMPAQMQQLQDQAPGKHNLDDMAITSWLEQEQSNEQNAEPFNWSEWNSGTLNMGDTLTNTQMFDQIPPTGVGRDWL